MPERIMSDRVKINGYSGYLAPISCEACNNPKLEIITAEIKDHFIRLGDYQLRCEHCQILYKLPQELFPFAFSLHYSNAPIETQEIPNEVLIKEELHSFSAELLHHKCAACGQYNLCFVKYNLRSRLSKLIVKQEIRLMCVNMKCQVKFPVDTLELKERVNSIRFLINKPNHISYTEEELDKPIITAHFNKVEMIECNLCGKYNFELASISTLRETIGIAMSPVERVVKICLNPSCLHKIQLTIEELKEIEHYQQSVEPQHHFKSMTKEELDSYVITNWSGKGAIKKCPRCMNYFFEFVKCKPNKIVLGLEQDSGQSVYFASCSKCGEYIDLDPPTGTSYNSIYPLPPLDQLSYLKLKIAEEQFETLYDDGVTDETTMSFPHHNINSMVVKSQKQVIQTIIISFLLLVIIQLSWYYSLVLSLIFGLIMLCIQLFKNKESLLFRINDQYIEIRTEPEDYVRSYHNLPSLVFFPVDGNDNYIVFQKVGFTYSPYELSMSRLNKEERIIFSNLLLKYGYLGKVTP
ncbi:MAG: hypothetical protein INQ03_12760 [Candidatus Heimdallarchaeota archaeon]|nr:hypothetical protein [Candidatus Heimdallarchaeota archaeon]